MAVTPDEIPRLVGQVRDRIRTIRPLVWQSPELGEAFGPAVDAMEHAAPLLDDPSPETVAVILETFRRIVLRADLPQPDESEPTFLLASVRREVVELDRLTGQTLDALNLAFQLPQFAFDDASIVERDFFRASWLLALAGRRAFACDAIAQLRASAKRLRLSDIERLMVDYTAASADAALAALAFEIERADFIDLDSIVVTSEVLAEATSLFDENVTAMNSLPLYGVAREAGQVRRATDRIAAGSRTLRLAHRRAVAAAVTTPVSMEDSEAFRRAIAESRPLPTEEFASVAALNLAFLGLREAPDLSRLSSLAWLDLSLNPLDRIDALAELRTLRVLDLSVTYVSDLEPLAKLTTLTELRLSGTSVRSVRPLAALKQLRALDLSRTAAADLAALRNIRTLETLNLRRTSHVNTRTLGGMTGIKVLNMRQARVTSLEFVRELPLLERLDLRGSTVRDLSPLAHHPSLRWLDLRDTRVRHQRALETCQKLKTIKS